jgi:hypothetical protein
MEAPEAGSRQQQPAHPLSQMSLEDLDFVLQFVLASGSLKEMARLYGVSYPTIRASLDRVISNLQDRIDGRPPDPMTDLLASLVERGEIKVTTATSIRALYRQALEKSSSR